MAEITAAMVMKLRDETGLPMMECKKALQETNGDFELAQAEGPRERQEDHGDAAGSQHRRRPAGACTPASSRRSAR